MTTIEERFHGDARRKLTESRSITSHTVFDRTEMLSKARPSTPSPLNFRDMVELDAQTDVAVECMEFLGLEYGSWLVEDVVISSIQFTEEGNIIVYWIARFIHAPKEG